jgi:hypothetical protein
MPPMLTFELPAFKFATCGAQGGEGGKGCATVGVPTIATLMLPIVTLDCGGVASVVVAAQMCPVDRLSPCTQTAGILLFPYAASSIFSFAIMYSLTRPERTISSTPNLTISKEVIALRTLRKSYSPETSALFLVCLRSS